MNTYEEIYHHGIKGQKWGVRRFQNYNGSLTKEGKRRVRDNFEREGASSKQAKRATREFNKRLKREEANKGYREGVEELMEDYNSKNPTFKQSSKEASKLGEKWVKGRTKELFNAKMQDAAFDDLARRNRRASRDFLSTAILGVGIGNLVGRAFDKRDPDSYTNVKRARLEEARREAYAEYDKKYNSHPEFNRNK